VNKKMNKKYSLLVGMLITAVICTIVLYIMLSVGGTSGRAGEDSSGFPYATFFVIFILPGIIAASQEKKRREQERIQQTANME
jgi:hypothetical protein